MAPRLELFPFRYRDPVTGKWVRARYVAELHEIKQRYVEWEIIGAPEVREVSSDERHFSPHQRETPLGNLGTILTIAGLKPGRRVAVAGQPVAQLLYQSVQKRFRPARDPGRARRQGRTWRDDSAAIANPTA